MMAYYLIAGMGCIMLHLYLKTIELEDDLIDTNDSLFDAWEKIEKLEKIGRFKGEE